MAASLRYMNNPSDPAADSQPSVYEASEPHPQPEDSVETHGPAATGGSRAGAAGEPVQHIKVGKRAALVSGKETEVFTMTLGVETIELLPLRNWGQLDIYKWRVRGKLPGTPAGLEITFDHLKLLGETVTTKDTDGCAKLEKLFSEWLEVERESLELAKKKAQTKPTAVTADAHVAAGPQPVHFQVEVDNKGMVHVRYMQGKETLASIGLNTAGFQSLISQGFMRKPHVIKTGALHDWVELDGVLFSFEKGNNDAAKLEEALNHSYLPLSSQGQGKEVVVYANAASSTGFDIQFPAKVGGLTEHRRRPLTEDTLDLLQDPEHCGLLQQGIVIKLTRPTLIFKKKTPDGGERYLDRSPANTVRVVDEDGDEKMIDLSQPVNYLHLSAVDLTAVFNHPSINRHTQAAPATSLAPKLATAPLSTLQQPPSGDILLSPARQIGEPPAPGAKVQIATQPPRATMGGAGEPAIAASRVPEAKPPQVAQTDPGRPSFHDHKPNTPSEIKATEALSPPPSPPSLKREARPNLWLKPILAQQPIRFDWLACLMYERIATWLRNSREGELLGHKCWVVEINEAQGEDALTAERCSKAIVLKGDGGFGFVRDNWICLFENGRVAFGPNESPLKADQVRLMATGMNAVGRFVFVVNDGYRSQLPKEQLIAMLAQLEQKGAVLLSAEELFESCEAMQVVWTVPVEQANPADPQALESIPTEPGTTARESQSVAASNG